MTLLHFYYTLDHFLLQDSFLTKSIKYILTKHFVFHYPFWDNQVNLIKNTLNATDWIGYNNASLKFVHINFICVFNIFNPINVLYKYNYIIIKIG